MKLGAPHLTVPLTVAAACVTWSVTETHRSKTPRRVVAACGALKRFPRPAGESS